MTELNIDQFMMDGDATLTAAIEEAINSGATKISFTAGNTYFLTDDIIIRDASNLEIDMSGATIEIIEPAEVSAKTGAAKISVIDSENITIRGGTIDGNDILTQAIQFSDCVQCTMTEVTIHNSGDTGAIVRAAGGNGNTFSENTIFDGNSTARALRLGNFFDSFLEIDLTVSGNTISDTGASAIVVAADGFKVENNSVTNSGGSGIVFGGANGFASENGTIQYNVVKENRFSGIQSDVFGTDISNFPRNIVIQNNVSIENSSSGIYAFHGQDFIISGNIIQNNRVAGIVVGRVFDASIEGNIILDTGHSEEEQAFWGVLLESFNSHIVVSGNVIAGYTEAGIRVSSGQAPSGSINLEGNLASSRFGPAIEIAGLVDDPETIVQVSNNSIPSGDGQLVIEFENVVASTPGPTIPVFSYINTSSGLPVNLAGGDLLVLDQEVLGALLSDATQQTTMKVVSTFTGSSTGYVLLNLLRTDSEFFGLVEAATFTTPFPLERLPGIETANQVLISDAGVFGSLEDVSTWLVVDTSSAVIPELLDVLVLELTRTQGRIRVEGLDPDADKIIVPNADGGDHVVLERYGASTVLRTNSGLEVTIEAVDARDVRMALVGNQDAVEVYDALTSIENENITITSGAGPDVIYAGATDNIIQGDIVGDAIFGGSGIDQIRLNGGSVFDVVSLQAGLAISEGGPQTRIQDVEDIRGSSSASERLIGSPFTSNRISGQGGDDELLGLGGHDFLDGGAGNDSLFGGTGQDRLELSAGIDTIEGGSGSDWLVLSDSLFGGVFDLAGGIAETEVGQARFIEIENAIGSNSADLITGSLERNSLFGRGGDDVIYSGGGEDVIYGGAGSNELHGSEAPDVFHSSGSDEIHGYGGVDWVRFDRFTTGVTVNLESGDYFSSGRSGALHEIEYVEGSLLADQIHGNSDVNILRGGLGNDTISGGKGNDILDGGGGHDLFLFAPGDGIDRVHSFDSLYDSISIESDPSVEISVFELGEDTVIQYGPDAIVLVGFQLEGEGNEIDIMWDH